MAGKTNFIASVIPLGGMGEIGKNMWAIRYGDDLVVLDAGVMFPEEEMLGIDYVIPDITYLRENQSRLRGIVLTHGHEDHIGALPYVLRELKAPVYGTRLTLGLVRGKLEEHGLARDADLREIAAGESLRLGGMKLEFIHVNHSIADVVAIAIHTPAGAILYATDFKFDYTPIDGRVTDLQRLAALGKEGVLALLSDSTNAERVGYTVSERSVGETFFETFRKAEGRILVATFASNIHRIQQVLDAAVAFHRKVCVVGRSMVNNVTIASKLGYLRFPEDLMIDLDEVDRYAPQQLAIITTGSQGEPMSALSRMAMAEHRRMEITPGDTVIISANPIPGNEKLVGKTVNHLFKLGANVIYHAFSGVHVSGHGAQEELKLMLCLTRPRYFIPIHGEYRMLKKHASLAEQVGVPEENIIIPDIGDVVEVGDGVFRKAERVSAGRVLVDGLGVGDVGNIVLRDRQQLSQDGILVVVLTVARDTGRVVAGPDIVTRGFVYVRESEALLEEAKGKVKAALQVMANGPVAEWGSAKGQVREILSRLLWEKTKRRPMILPIVVEV